MLAFEGGVLERKGALPQIASLSSPSCTAWVFTKPL